MLITLIGFPAIPAGFSSANLTITYPQGFIDEAGRVAPTREVATWHAPSSSWRDAAGGTFKILGGTNSTTVAAVRLIFSAIYATGPSVVQKSGGCYANSGGSYDWLLTTAGGGAGNPSSVAITNATYKGGYVAGQTFSRGQKAEQGLKAAV